MWPSNDEVKNTLCETGVILFRESHLQLNPRIDLAKTFLDRELLISAIDASNALFDQKEKLKLAVLLRDYIYSSSYLDTLHLNIQNFWKDCYEFLKSFLVEFPIISIFLILTFVPVFLPIRWLKIKLDIRSTERKQIKQRENLSLGIEEAKNQSNLINPLTIIHGPELFKIPEKKQSLVPNLTEERLIENLADIFNLLSKKSERPLNADSSNEVTESAGRSIEKLVENVNAINKQFEAPIITLEKVIENLVALYQLFEEPNLTLDKMTQNLFAINESSESANPSIDKMIPNLIAINDLFSA